MTFDPDKFLRDTEPTESSFDPDAFLAATEQPSQLEAAGRGAIQGATLGFGEEIGAAIRTPIELLMEKVKGLVGSEAPLKVKETLAGDTSDLSSLYEGKSPEAVDQMLQDQGFTGAVEGQSAKEKYQELRGRVREANTAAREANPGTYLAGELAGGIAPGFLSGGAATVASTAKTGLGKAALKGAGYGAAQGAVAGLGYSDADLTEGDVSGAALDTLIGAGTGVIVGGALPVAGKALKSTYEGTKKGAGWLGERIPFADSMKTAGKFGFQGKDLNVKELDKELNRLSKEVFDNIKADKEVNNLKKGMKLLDEKGYTINSKQSIQEAIDDMKIIYQKSNLKNEDIAILKKLEDLVREDSRQALKMAEKAKKNAIKKQIESQSKIQQAIIKGEKEMAKVEARTGDELKMLTDKEMLMEGMEIPLDTKNGVIAGATGKFKKPDSVLPSGEVVPGKTYNKTSLSDATEYQPEIMQLEGTGGRPINITKDLGSGKVSAIVGDIEESLYKNKDGISFEENKKFIDELEMVISGGDFKDPIIQRAAALKKQLTNLADDVIDSSGDTSLIAKRKRHSDIFSAEELLKTKDRLSPKMDINDMLVESKISSKLGFEQGHSGRNEVAKIKELLGDKIITPEAAKQYELLQKVAKLVNTEGKDNASLTGLLRSSTTTMANALGQVAGKVSKVTSKVTNPIMKAKDMLNKMSNDKIVQTAQKLSATGNKGKQHIASQLEKYATSEGAAKSQALWAMSQSPAIRSLVGREVDNADKGFTEAIGIPPEERIELPLRREAYREPDSVKNIDEGLTHILNVEAGYQNHPEDTGNFLNGVNIGTNRGITPKTYKDYYGKDPTVEDMKSLSKEQATKIYKDVYIKQPGFNKIKDPNLQTSLVDFAINSGTGNALALLKRLIGSELQGGVGPDILSKIDTYEGDLNNDLLEARREFINKGNPTFRKGWNSRIDNLKELTSPEPKLQDGGIAEKPSEGIDTKAVEREIDRVNQQKSSGETTPVDQLDALLEKIDALNMDQSSKDELEHEAITMNSYSDGEALKQKIRSLLG